MTPFHIFQKLYECPKAFVLNKCWLGSFTDMTMCPSGSLKHLLENIEQLESVVKKAFFCFLLPSMFYGKLD